MRLRRRAAQVQPQAHAAGGTGACGVGAMEGLAQVRQLPGRQSL
jgi:hypothetical protein